VVACTPIGFQTNTLKTSLLRARCVTLPIKHRLEGTRVSTALYWRYQPVGLAPTSSDQGATIRKTRRVSSHTLTAILILNNPHLSPEPSGTCMQVEIRAVCPSAAGYSVSCSGDPRKAERHTLFREPATGVSVVVVDLRPKRGSATERILVVEKRKRVCYGCSCCKLGIYRARAVAARLCSLPSRSACRVM
jgi:hypothetical protein